MPKSVVRRAAVSVTAVGVIAIAATPALAAGQTASGWQLVFSKQYPVKGSGPYSAFTAAAAVGPNDAWAVGGTSAAGSSGGRPIALRWDNGAWHQTWLPARLGGILGAVSAPAANDVWAVSQLSQYVVHWNGKRWSIAKSWPESGLLDHQLTGVAAFSATNVWVFGGNGADPGMGTWHLRGRTWTKVKGVSIDTASAVGPANIWAIADGPDAPGQLIEHYNGTKWSPVTHRGLAGFGYNAILAVSARSVWLGGTVTTKTSQQVPELARWDGHGWRQVALKLPVGTYPDSMTADGHGGFWLNAYGRKYQWAVHVSANGKTSRIGLPTAPARAIPIPGSSSLWAVGAIERRTGWDASIWLHRSRP